MKKISTITIGILCVSCIFTVNGTGKAEERSKAAQWLATQVDEYSKRIYVYADYSDSKNAFTQRGFMGGGGADLQFSLMTKTRETQ